MFKKAQTCTVLNFRLHMVITLSSKKLTWQVPFSGLSGDPFILVQIKATSTEAAYIRGSEAG